MRHALLAVPSPRCYTAIAKPAPSTNGEDFITSRRVANFSRTAERNAVASNPIALYRIFARRNQKNRCFIFCEQKRCDRRTLPTDQDHRVPTTLAKDHYEVSSQIKRS